MSARAAREELEGLTHSERHLVLLAWECGVEAPDLEDLVAAELGEEQRALTQVGLTAQLPALCERLGLAQTEFEVFQRSRA